MIRRLLVAATVLGAATHPTVSAAQDVEMLGAEYGTTPPSAYFARKADPGAFQFRRAWTNRTGTPLLTDAEGASFSAPQGTPLGERPNGIAGTLAFPLILGQYSDSPEAPTYDAEAVQKQFFTGPNPTGTIPEFYADQSAGLLTLTGTTFAWSRSTMTGETVAGGVSGLGSPGRVGAFIKELLTALDDGSIDWGQFDNDGPDGMPDSGDDDGYVDVLAVMHPTAGAECSGAKDVVWSHRWSLRFAAGSDFATSIQGANGAAIRIDDYTIQPVLSCEGGAINEIGVFAHELGHGLGLPDLYDTDNAGGRHGAAGRWDLMATGSWGCRGGNPARPCDLGAWSKSMLGWIDVETLGANQDHGTVTLAPTNEGARKALRVDAGDGSSEYFLLENRSRAGFNAEIFAQGLLVWHIDDAVLANRWNSNRVNADPERMGVWLRAADGLNQAAQDGDNRGDEGDPFPGSSGNTVFHAGSTPASYSHQGGATGFTLLDLALMGDDVSFRALTRFQRLDLTTDGTGGASTMVSIDGAPAGATDLAVQSAPFQQHTIEAAPGSPLGPGLRSGFVGWEDGSDRLRTFVTQLEDSVLTAEYGGDREVLLSVEMASSVQGIDPGQIETFPTSSDGWFDEGQDVAITAVERTGFAFQDWSGDLAGSSNPVTLTLNAPLTATAHFDVIFGVGGAAAEVTMEAARHSQVTLEADNANLPVQWILAAGTLPTGVQLTQAGVITGTAMESGDFPVTVRAVDAIGLVASAPLALRIDPPAVGSATLGAPFYGQGAGPTDDQLTYLDRNGNANGRYDLGDFRAFVLANPDLPATTGPVGAPQRSIVRVPLRFEAEGGR